MDSKKNLPHNGGPAMILEAQKTNCSWENRDSQKSLPYMGSPAMILEAQQNTLVLKAIETQKRVYPIQVALTKRKCACVCSVCVCSACVCVYNKRFSFFWCVFVFVFTTTSDARTIVFFAFVWGNPRPSHLGHQHLSQFADPCQVRGPAD